MLTNVAEHDFLRSDPDDLRQFTLDFFESFGAQVEEPLPGQETIQAHLSQDLTDHFGKAILSLYFHSGDESIERELVAHGSRVFDQMVEYLTRRGALTVQKLPSRYAGGEELMRLLHPLNCSVVNLSMREATEQIFVFNWRITYRADDKREELFTVVLNDNGARLPLHNEQSANPRAVDLEALLADAVNVVPSQQSQNDRSTAIKLPPMTRLTHLAESARTFAVYHADLRSVAHEAEIQPRLYKALQRLTRYYEQQIQEVYDTHDPDGEKRRGLESDLARKIAEEVENHRLSVRVELFSYAILQMPISTAALTLSDGHREAKVNVRRNRYNGAITRPSCHACGGESGQISLDRNGHITCDACICQCGACLDLLCAACGVAACPVCGVDQCDACGRDCWACGERACADHVSACPTCGDTVCHACQVDCNACGARQCRSHLRVDCVPGDGGTTHYICPECAVRCPSCQQFSASTALCDMSGQQFCTDCLATCAGCGNRVGAGFFTTYQEDGQTYCSSCLQTCVTCRAQTPKPVTCQVCGLDCCPSCGLFCDICAAWFCADHASVDPGCGHVTCAAHGARCGVGEEGVCPSCATVCGICERYCCTDHEAICSRCAGAYCIECIRRSGICDTCATMTRDGERVVLCDEPCATAPAVAKLAPKYQWVRAGNARYTIYLGSNVLGRSAIVVVDGWNDGEGSVACRTIGLYSVLQDWFRK